MRVSQIKSKQSWPWWHMHSGRLRQVDCKYQLRYFMRSFSNFLKGWQCSSVQRPRVQSPGPGKQKLVSCPKYALLDSLTMNLSESFTISEELPRGWDQVIFISALGLSTDVKPDSMNPGSVKLAAWPWQVGSSLLCKVKDNMLLWLDCPAAL